MAPTATEGFLHDDIPHLRIGAGPPLVMVQGLTAEHDVPKGFERRVAVAGARPHAGHFTVYAVNRKRGLQPGESMSDIAGHLANAIEHDIGEPVFLQGTSTGGSVVLQLAVDRPELVRRLVVVSSAYRLGPAGRALQAETARLIREGRPLDGLTHLAADLFPEPLRGPLRPVARAFARSMMPDDPTDMLVTLDAEDVFDVEADLHRITAPTLVIGGTKDRFYTPQLFEGTAAGVPRGRLHLFDGWGHVRAASSGATANMMLGFLLAE